VGARRKLHGPVATPATWAAAAGIVAVLVVGWLALGGGAPTVEALVAAGAKVDALVEAGAWWRLVTAGVLHTGPTHLLLNGVLIVFALLAYSRLGRTRSDEGAPRALAAVAVLVLASAGGFLVSFVARAGPSVGSSAAAHGLLAAVVAGVWLRRGDLPPSVRWLGPGAVTAAFVVVLVASSSIAGLDHAAHAGGAAIGAALAPLVDRPATRARVVVVALALGVVIAATIAALTAR